MGIYDYTIKEIQQFINVQSERRRRDAKTQSVIAFRQAALIASMLSGEKSEYNVSEEFPFWTDAELQQMRYDTIRQRMEDSYNKSQLKYKK